MMESISERSTFSLFFSEQQYFLDLERRRSIMGRQGEDLSACFSSFIELVAIEYYYRRMSNLYIALLQNYQMVDETQMENAHSLFGRLGSQLPKTGPNPLTFHSFFYLGQTDLLFPLELSLLFKDNAQDSRQYCCICLYITSLQELAINRAKYINPMPQLQLQPVHLQLSAAIQNILKVLADYDRKATPGNIFQDTQQLENLLNIVFICFENADYYYLEILQQMAACFNLAFKDATEKFTFEFTLKMYFSIVTNWKIGYKVKQFLRLSFFTILQYWSKELDHFFEKLAFELLKSLDMIRQQDNGDIYVIESEPIFNCTTNSMYSYVINMPSDEIYVYESLMFILEGLFIFHKEDADSPDTQNILAQMQIFRKVINHIFAVENVMRYKSSVLIALDILSEIISYEGDVLKGLVYEELYKWKELFLLFQGIYRLQTVQDEYTPLGYNYFVWEEHSQDLAKIKQNTTEVHSYFSSEANLNLPVPFHEQLVSIVEKDLLGSLKYFASYRGQVPQELSNMAKQYMGLFINYFQIITLKTEEMKEVLFSVLLPILRRQIDERKVDYVDKPHELMSEIDECLEDQQSYHILSHCCYILDILLSDDDNFVQFLAKYLTASLIENREELYNISGSYEPLDKTTCFFILHVTSLTERNCTTLITLFQYLLTPEYFHRMTSYEKAYLYGYLSAEWSLIYKNNKKAGEFYFDYIFDPNIDQPLKKFAINFIFNITAEYYNENFFYNFLKNFQIFAPQDDALSIVSRTVQFHSNKFNVTFAVDIIRAIVGSIDKSVLASAAQNGQSQSDDNRYVSSIFYELKCISKIKSICYDQSQIYKQLMKFVIDYFELSRQLILQDTLGQIICNLLELSKDMPLQLFPVIREYIVVYQTCEYQGVVILKIMNRMFRISDNNNQALSLLFGALIEAISYIAYFPDSQDIINQFKFQISNHLIVLQHALLVYGDRIPSVSIEDLHNIAINLIANLETHNQAFKFPETILQARLSNFKLILDIFKGCYFSLEELIQKAKRHIFSGYDAQLLIFILDRTKYTFKSQQDRYNLLTLMAKLLKTINEHDENKKKYIKLTDEKRHLNQLIANLIIPFQMHDKVEDGVHFFVSSLVQTDPEQATLIEHLEESDREVIVRNLATDVTTSDKKQHVQATNGRQMLKIVNKRRECNSSMLDELHTFKKKNKKRTHQNLSEDSDNEEGYTQNRKKKNADLSKSQRINEKFMRRQQTQ